MPTARHRSPETLGTRWNHAPIGLHPLARRDCSKTKPATITYWRQGGALREWRTKWHNCIDCTIPVSLAHRAFDGVFFYVVCVKSASRRHTHTRIYMGINNVPCWPSALNANPSPALVDGWWSVVGDDFMLAASCTRHAQTRSNGLSLSDVLKCALMSNGAHTLELYCARSGQWWHLIIGNINPPRQCVKRVGFFLLLFVEPNGKPITFDWEKKKETKSFNGAYGVYVDVTSVRCSVRELLHVDSCTHTHTHSRIESDRVKSMSCRCRKNVYRPLLQLCRMWMSATTFYPPSSKLTRISTRGSRTEKEESYALPSRTRKLEGIGRW